MPRASSSEGVTIDQISVQQRAGRGAMTNLDKLERVLFMVFVVASDAFFLGIVPILSFATLVSFLAFVLLVDHLRSKRYEVRDTK